MYYSTVEEAKKVFDKPENIEVDGRVLVIDFKKPECKDKSICTVHLFLVFLVRKS